METQERLLKERGERQELVDALAPLLKRRYKDRSGLAILELGPGETTIVARTLAGHFSQYIGLDHYPHSLAKQRQNLAADGIANVHGVRGSTYAMPFADDSQDVVVASCHGPVLSGTEDEVRLAYSEIHRVLKTDGELILLPWHEAGDFRPGGKPSASEICYMVTPQHVAAMPFQFFDLVESCRSTIVLEVPNRMILALRK